ncbi:uncharacterized protein LOC120901365 isoform X2 [Anopheles arabiensis]|uniref:uncharacterized protein LOC120901365 isoform X2 n=1 Tax=Anopheles arabiensis TaxID=7173 RepID=UPI001AAD3379|nr:uncharacterized protein LOC120901365 isoform X2 [Anopheles arabiensis]
MPWILGEPNSRNTLTNKPSFLANSVSLISAERSINRTQPLVEAAAVAAASVHFMCVFCSVFARVNGFYESCVTKSRALALYCLSLSSSGSDHRTT